MRILFTTFFDPADLGCRQLAAYMKELGHEVRIVALKYAQFVRPEKNYSKERIAEGCVNVTAGEARFKGAHLLQAQEAFSEQELKTLADVVEKWNPDIIGFGTRTKNIIYLPDVIPVFRKAAPQAFIVAGGIGPTLDPKTVFSYGVDVVVRGEGEYPLRDLAEALESGKDWSKINNLAYIKEEELILNPLYPPQLDLDNFPQPFFQEEDIILIDDSIGASQHVNVFTSLNNVYITLASRGCIADCSYCAGRSLRTLYQKDGTPMPKIRRRSLQKVLDEIKHIKRIASPTVISIHDEFFLAPYTEMLDFLNRYKDEVALPFLATFVPDQLAAHPDLINAAVDAGLFLFSIGVQSGDEKFCRKVYNRYNNNENILKLVHKFHDLGLSTQIFMIMGNPLESVESIEKSLTFARQLPPFDASLKQRIFFITNKLFIPTGGDILLTKNFPEIERLTDEYANSTFYYYSMMLEFRLLLDDTKFEQLYSDTKYKTDPHPLGSLYHETVRQKHLKYWEKEYEALQGRKVCIFGGGSAYQACRDQGRLRGLDIGMFINDFDNRPKNIDGIPVFHPQEVLSKDPSIPVVLVSRPEHVNTMFVKLKRKYPEVHSISSCVLL